MLIVIESADSECSGGIVMCGEGDLSFHPNKFDIDENGDGVSFFFLVLDDHLYYQAPNRNNNQ